MVVEFFVLSILLFVVFIIVVGVWYFFTTSHEKEEKIELLSRTIGELTEAKNEFVKLYEESNATVKDLYNALIEEEEKNKKILSQKKSSETRLGQVAEQLAPFLKDCKYDPKIMHFLGQPIDFLVIDYDLAEIIFLEVKSGNAKESARQKLIKNIIKDGRIYYEKMRINEKGTKIIREKNNE